MTEHGCDRASERSQTSRFVAVSDVCQFWSVIAGMDGHTYKCLLCIAWRVVLNASTPTPVLVKPSLTVLVSVVRDHVHGSRADERELGEHAEFTLRSARRACACVVCDVLTTARLFCWADEWVGGELVGLARVCDVE